MLERGKRVYTQSKPCLNTHQKHSSIKEDVAKYLFLTCSVVSIFLLLLISVFIFKDSASFIARVGLSHFLLNELWAPMNTPPSYGIAPMVLGSVVITLLASVGAIPIAIMVASYLAFDCPKNIYRVLKASLNLMTGIPSIVYGFFALSIIVPIVRSACGGDGMNMLSASILLLIMILPTICMMSESALRATQASFYQGARALGATHDKTVLTIMIPAAKSGIFAGVILGIGRAIGETMAVILVAGNQTRLTLNPLKGIRTMTTNIVMEMAYATGEHQEALIATAAVLFVFILAINVCLFYIKNRGVSHA